MSEYPATPPENARIVRPDGTEIPLELHYTGERIADDGRPMHVWEAVSEYMLQIPPDQLSVGILPPRTEIALRMRRPDGP